MKCPKCAYLGFDTGERCKNCGYDFSLMVSSSAAEEPAAELSLHGETDRSDRLSAPAAAAALAFEPTLPPPSFRGEPALPLFTTSAAGEDEPLIKVPSQPRAPLAVRRTPESPRLRAVAKPVSRSAPEPVLDFIDEPRAATASAPASRVSTTAAAPGQASGAGRRIVAAVFDHAILFTIDAVVVYLTLRIASLTMGEWRALPMLPMGTFLGLLKLAYFSAFTYVGGQTIGKMAVGIRVVGDDDRPLDAPHAVHRALAGAVSFLTLGAGFLPAVFGADRRALHDRLAHTRVVVLPGA